MLMQHEVMKLGIDRARRTMRANIGGPFGAVVMKDDGEIISIASNTVLRDNDPTCHAEINAIREACKILGTYDLSDCTIFATSAPCPMCLSAIMWANIKTVLYGCTAEDAANIGFRDDFMYDFIKSDCSDSKVVKMIPSCRERCLSLFNEYQESNKELY